MNLIFDCRLRVIFITILSLQTYCHSVWCPILLIVKPNHSVVVMSLGSKARAVFTSGVKNVFLSPNKEAISAKVLLIAIG